MRLKQFIIEGVLGARSVAVACEQPVTLIAGKNGAGKSSVRETFVQTLIGDTVRVALKKEYGQLVNGHAKKGRATIEFDTMSATLVLPSGDRKGTGSLPTSDELFALCLEPEKFARMSEKDRRTALFDLMRVKVTGKAVVEKLKARGVDEKKAAEVVPLVAAGFDVGAKEAAGKARDAKAAWRAVTGETWGSDKGEGWAPEAPMPVPEYTGRPLADIDAEIADVNQQIGVVQGQIKAHQQQVQNMVAARDKAGRLDRIVAKLETDRAAVCKWEPKVEETRARAAGKAEKTCSCPECGTVLVHEAGALKKYEPTTVPDPEAVAKLPEYEQALRLLKNAVTNGERDLADAQAAQRLIADLSASAAPDEQSIEPLRAKLGELQAERQQAQKAVEASVAAGRARGEAAKKATDAAAHHADVLAWLAIAEALAPEGIPAEFLTDAIKPFNLALMEESRAAGWPDVMIREDMTIAYGGRPYTLCSESEKWRADALIAACIAQKSGAGFFMLDRLDVLDVDGRSDALYWLDGLGAVGVSALVFGTLKNLPSQLPRNIGGAWIEEGVAEVGALEEVAA